MRTPMPDPAFDFHNRQIERLRERNRWTAHAKDVTERDAFVAQCTKAVQDLLSASTAATGLAVDVPAIGATLADLILASPAR